MARNLYGMNLPTTADSDLDPVAVAVLAEELGFDFVSSSDHPIGDHPTNETWTLLSWVAASTSRVKVVTRVLGVPFRLPALTAKMAETLGRLSGGRLVLGLGAGAQDAEIAALGSPVLSPGGKVEALEEAVTVIRGIWSGPEFTHHGAHHDVDRATISPLPTDPIPIWLGSYGPRSLAVAGRVADGWIPSLSYAGADQLEQMRARVIDAAERIGRPQDSITCVLNVGVKPGAEPESGVIAGSPSQITEQLGSFLDMGFDGFNFMFSSQSMEDSARMIASEVLPAIGNSHAASDAE